MLSLQSPLPPTTTKNSKERGKHFPEYKMVCFSFRVSRRKLLNSLTKDL